MRHSGHRGHDPIAEVRHPVHCRRGLGRQAMWAALREFVDRDVARWRGRSMIIFACVVPILLLDLAFDGPPSEAPTVLLIIAIATSTLVGGYVLWRELRFEWNEFRRIRELAAQEESEG